MKLILIIIFLFISVFSLKAQVKIYTIFAETITGFKTGENDSLMQIRSIHGNNYTVKKGIINKIGNLKSEIILKDGSRFIGNIKFIDSTSLVFFGADSIEKKFNLDKVLKYKIGERLYGSGYTFIGITGLGPGGINILCGVQFENTYFFRVEYGATFGNDIYGYQFNFGYNLVRLKNMEQNISFGAGISFNRKNWETLGYKSTAMTNKKYLGFFYDLNYYGLFIEAGAMVGDGEKSSFQIGFQFGYVYRFL